VLTRHLNKMPPALSGVSMVLDPATKQLFLGATSLTQIDLFIDQFYRATKLEAIQLTPALILDREFHTLPARLPALELTGGPVGPAEVQPGRDFLTWLLYYAEKTGKLTVNGHDFDVMIDSPLLLAGDGEAHGSQETAVKNGGSPLRSAEVKAALGVGKKLRKAKILLARGDVEKWTFSFDADAFTFSGLSLPETESMEINTRFEERVLSLNIFLTAFEAYFQKFASDIMSGKAAFQKEIVKWAADRESL